MEYYKTFYPESKKEEILFIENNNIKEGIFNDYSKAKSMFIRKPLIFLLFEKDFNNNESNITKSVEKWNKIEKEIKNRQYQDCSNLLFFVFSIKNFK